MAKLTLAQFYKSKILAETVPYAIGFLFVFIANALILGFLSSRMSEVVFLRLSAWSFGAILIGFVTFSASLSTGIIFPWTKNLHQRIDKILEEEAKDE